jgi:NAD-dependent SIR2 family protein deacetylase
MYGEALPQHFFELSPQDVAQADCVIIMGTSLAVKPFSEPLTRCITAATCVTAAVHLALHRHILHNFARRSAAESRAACAAAADEHDGRREGGGVAARPGAAGTWQQSWLVS